MTKKVIITIDDGEYVHEIVIQSCKTFKQVDDRIIKVNQAIIKIDENITSTKEIEI